MIFLFFLIRYRHCRTSKSTESFISERATSGDSVVSAGDAVPGIALPFACFGSARCRAREAVTDGGSGNAMV